MLLNKSKPRGGDYRVLVPHWEAAIDGKVFAVVAAPSREAARERAARQYLSAVANPISRVTVRYLSNR